MRPGGGTGGPVIPVHMPHPSQPLPSLHSPPFLPYIQPQGTPEAWMNSLLDFWHFSTNEPSAKDADNPPCGRRKCRLKAHKIGVSPYADRFPNLPFSDPIFQWGIPAAYRTLFLLGLVPRLTEPRSVRLLAYLFSVSLRSPSVAAPPGETSQETEGVL